MEVIGLSSPGESSTLKPVLPLLSKSGAGKPLVNALAGDTVISALAARVSEVLELMDEITPRYL